MKMIHEKIYAKKFMYIFSYIYDALIFCVMPGKDKTLDIPEE